MPTHSNNVTTLADAMVQAIRGIEKPTAPKPCAVCGKPTRDEFFRVSLCNPYDRHGVLVNRCKYVYAQRRESAQ